GAETGVCGSAGGTAKRLSGSGAGGVDSAGSRARDRSRGAAQHIGGIGRRRGQRSRNESEARRAGEKIVPEARHEFLQTSSPQSPSEGEPTKARCVRCIIELPNMWRNWTTVRSRYEGAEPQNSGIAPVFEDLADILFFIIYTLRDC